MTALDSPTATADVGSLSRAGGPPAPADGWKELRVGDLRTAEDLLDCLDATGCRRWQFALIAEDGSFVVRWV